MFSGEFLKENEENLRQIKKLFLESWFLNSRLLLYQYETCDENVSFQPQFILWSSVFLPLLAVSFCHCKTK